MADRTTETLVTFRHPFALPSVGETLPAGTYRVVLDEEEILGLSFLAFQHRATTLHLPSIAVSALPRQMIPISPEELAAAVKADERDPRDGL